MRTRTLELLLYNLSRLLFSSKGFVTCAFDKYKDYFENYYALKLLIKDITYKHDLSKIYVRELMLVLISRMIVFRPLKNTVGLT